MENSAWQSHLKLPFCLIRGCFTAPRSLGNVQIDMSQVLPVVQESGVLNDDVGSFLVKISVFFGLLDRLRYHDINS